MIDPEKNKAICPYLFKGALLEHSQGNIRPCCRWETDDVRGDNVWPKKNFLINKDEKYNSYFTEARQQMIDGKPVYECRGCITQEKHGIESMRTNALKNFVNDNESLIKIEDLYRKPTGLLKEITVPKLEYLEIESGRYCNLKCRSCGPELSTSWDEDLKLSKDLQNHFFGNEPKKWKNLLDEKSINQYLESIEYDTIKDLKTVKITGGEPFLSDSVLKFLNNLVDFDIAKNIILEVFTNCSFFPKEKYREILPKFKRVHIILSLDGVGEHMEFLRKKSKWEVVEKVSKYWEGLSLSNKNIYLEINHTITLYNVLYIGEFLFWIFKHFSRELLEKHRPELGGFIKLTEVWNPSYLCVNNTSDIIKEKMLSSIKSDQILLEEKLLKLGYDEEFLLRFHIKTMFIELYDFINGAGKDKVKTFIEKANMFDSIRKENWKETFPKLVKILND